MPSVFARCSLIFLVAAGCALDPEPDELIQEVGSVAFTNPGFESDFAGWTKIEPVAISSVAHGGSRAAKLSGKTGQVKRVVAGLTPATSYKLSAWLLGNARLGARNHGGAEVSAAVSSKVWTETSVTFTTGASSTSVEIFAAWKSGNAARVDDFTLVATSAPPPPPPPEDMELTPPASAVTASTSDTNLPAGAVDGSLATRWSGQGDGAWLRLDLGGTATVTRVKVAVHDGTTRQNRFDIQVSGDGAAWTTVWSGLSSGSTTALETIDVTDAPARYVRYLGHGYLSGTTTGTWNSVTEIEVHGTGFTSDPTPTPPPPLPPPPTCTLPSQMLDLTSWKITVPIGTPESPTEVLQPALASYVLDPWFVPTATCDGVRFRAHTSAPTTSGSTYPRSELREMTGTGGTTKAAWSTTSGTHRMFIDQAITAVPLGKKHVVAGQIHDASDDVIVIRLEYPKLFIDIGGSDGPTLDANYSLGKRFTVEFVASGGAIQIFYNGSTTPAYTLSRSVSGCYFKAGAYTQSNCTTESNAGQSCGESNYGEVEIHDLWVRHD